MRQPFLRNNDLPVRLQPVGVFLTALEIPKVDVAAAIA